MAAKKRFDAVIVAVSANNVIKVVEQLDAVYPGVEVWCALDNDIEAASQGKGNTGIKVGIDVMKRFPNVRCTRPLFSDDQLTPAGKIPNDFNDLVAISGITEANRQLFSNDNRVKLSAHPFEAELLALSVAPTGKQHRRTFSRQLIACIDAGMLLCPAKMSPKELIAVISSQLKAAVLMMRSVIRLSAASSAGSNRSAKRLSRSVRSAIALLMQRFARTISHISDSTRHRSPLRFLRILSRCMALLSFAPEWVRASRNTCCDHSCIHQIAGVRLHTVSA